MMTKTCCFIGLRPEHLPWGFCENDPGCMKLKKLIYQKILRLVNECGVTHFISGMGRGVDTYAAEAVLLLKKAYPVTLECVLPWEEQAASWPEGDRERYYKIIERADGETMLQHQYTWDCWRKRNRYMIERSQYVLAVWDGSHSGTGKTVQYACRNGRQVIIIHPYHL
ncbi:MAG: SLOG family protein [Christensenellales bacterium]